MGLGAGHLKGLWARLIVGVLGATVVAGTLAAVIFFIWQSDTIRQEQFLSLTLDAEQKARTLTRAPESNWEASISEHTGEDGLDFTLIASHGGNHSSGREAFVAVLSLDTPHSLAGYQHAVVSLHGERWLALVASVPAHKMYDKLYNSLATALLWFLLLALALVALTMLFYRRLVIGPVERLKELVGEADATGLSQFGEVQPGDFGFLSRGIISMNQKMADDAQELSHRLDDLTQAQGQLVRAERLAVVGQLAAGVAHEVGNPLAVVSGYVEMMSAGDLEASQQERALESMGRELERMNRTIRDLLDFSRDEVSESTRSDLMDAVDHVKRLLASQSRWRKVEFKVCEDSEPVELRIGADKLVQVLLNLCLNGCKAMQGEGKLQISWQVVGEHVEIYIDDSGPGVAPGQRQEIFQPFFTTGQPGEGTGLGLSVCENIVTRVDGKIWVEDSTWQGARFVLSLIGKRLENAQ
jgi:two-component system, NtrC family, sensor kinase